jgi:hypothetical protein
MKMIIERDVTVDMTPASRDETISIRESADTVQNEALRKGKFPLLNPS